MSTMRRTAALSPRSAVIDVASRWRASLQSLWDALAQDDDERFLCEAWDLADLERRLRRLEQGRMERFGPLSRGS